ncbi:MAG TPA: DNA alkylation repair protein [Spirochaetota bacterium]|nr:DNA alkylation repair protein [Spirochaetota bacterium]
MDLNELKAALRERENPAQARHLSRFFKTGKGQYGEGDIFLGIKVPELRKITKSCREIPLSGLQKLLNSGIHEERFSALLILVDKYKHSTSDAQGDIFTFYIKNAPRINNWDLVDLSAAGIAGHYLMDRDRSILHKLAGSVNLWEKRISIVATHYFIKQGDMDTTFEIADILMGDTHDLIHKAVGWMLREAGNRNHGAEINFLNTRYREMPRTMLRYAIEKFPDDLRRAYLKGTI